MLYLILDLMQYLMLYLNSNLDSLSKPKLKPNPDSRLDSDARSDSDADSLFIVQSAEGAISGGVKNEKLLERSFCTDERLLSSWKRHTGLPLVLPAAILIGDVTLLIRLKEEHLRNTFTGIDLCRKIGRIGKLQCHMPFPLRL